MPNIDIPEVLEPAFDLDGEWEGFQGHLQDLIQEERFALSDR